MPYPDFIVGSRKSQLALVQTNLVVTSILQFYPECTFKIVHFETKGDKILDKPLPKIGEKSLFTAELELALSKNEIDFIVHSLKDLPTTLPDGMVIASVSHQVSPEDCVIISDANKGYDLRTLPKNSFVGTSSLRRSSQLFRIYPHLKVESIISSALLGLKWVKLRKYFHKKGKSEYAIEKLNDDQFDAIILAYAGIHRLGMNEKVTQVLNSEDYFYAIGQGIIGVECRDDDFQTLKLLSSLTTFKAALDAITQRTFLHKLNAGCSTPVGVRCAWKDDKYSIAGFVSSLDGKEFLIRKKSVSLPFFEAYLAPERHELNNGGANDDKNDESVYSSIFCKTKNETERRSLEECFLLSTSLGEEMLSLGASSILSKARDEMN